MVDYDAERSRRASLAIEREIAGLIGEQVVFEAEREKLERGGRPELAQRVRLVSIDKSQLGYDVLSFTLDGQELHIEVKATRCEKGSDMPFSLTEKERAAGHSDPRWTLYRVWSVGRKAEVKVIGNIVQGQSGEWELSPESWKVSRRTGSIASG